MFKNLQGNSANRSDEESAAPKCSPVLAVKDAPKLVEERGSSFAFKFPNHLREATVRRRIEDKMQVIGFAGGFDDSTVDKLGLRLKSLNYKVSSFNVEYMPAKLHTPNDVVSQSKDAMACCFKFLIPDELAHRLEALYQPSLSAARRMLKRRGESSSKFYPEIPSVVSKSLIAKYQRNPKCKSIRNLVLPICGDKGRQIKTVPGGIRIPAIFGKSVIPVAFPRPIEGCIRSAEFFRTEGRWFCALCYNTPLAQPVRSRGCIGMDRNSVGNVAVFADAQTGTVRKLGICPARTKSAMRGRRKNLQKAGKFRLLSKLRRKQRRRMTHENHRASKSVVDYAAKHCRAVAIEKLDGVRSEGSKIRRYSEKNQWAFAQLETFLRYKCALRGVPVIEVDPAYTSQTCSRCGSRHKPNGKRFSCGTCGHNDHRDANAALNIGQLGLWRIDGSSGSLSVLSLRSIGGPQAGKVGAK